ncbi:MAG: DEAD/DEAH box helicase [Fibrobacterota bacterium]|nr:DEAD/DEAH box helicase [Fibrobacterota bacterium]
MLFRDLNLIPSILSAVEAEGYTKPTPVQTACIPSILEGRDVLGCAQTGTGKTAAFALPMLQNLSANRPANGRPIRALILTPTRELALQIAESFAVYGKNLDLRMAVIFGGVGDGPQKAKLRAGVDILVATPGRLMDLLGQRSLTLGQIEIFTLDEADRMLDMGFINDVRKVCQLLPAKRQTLLFSATMPSEISKLAQGLLRNPVKVEVTPVATTAEKIEQSVYMVTKDNKTALLRHILADEAVSRVLVFTRTKHGADRLKKNLEQFGIPSEAIHGNKSQNARVRSLSNFKEGSTRVLVATDLAARGLDVDEITHIVNYDLPHEPETYVHRIGRTARAGHSGISFSFCGPDDRGNLVGIERLIRQRIRVVPIPHESELKTPVPQEIVGRSAASDDIGRSVERSDGRNPRGQRNGGRSEGQGRQRSDGRRDSGHRRPSAGHNPAGRAFQGDTQGSQPARVSHEAAGSQPTHAPRREDSRPSHMRGNGNTQPQQGQGQGQEGNSRGPSKRRSSQGQGKEYVREYFSNGR